MTATDEVLKANDAYARNFDLCQVPAMPARKLAVVTCMDARIMPSKMLGLDIGDAHVIRNAGGIVTEDVLRSLIISHHLLGVQEFMVINHTDCGMLKFKDEDLRVRLTQKTGSALPISFHAFTNLDENVAQQVQKLRAHPWVPTTILIRGFVYDVQTGRLREVCTG